jgi:ParB/RepB/Spo0J family partition protein
MAEDRLKRTGEIFLVPFEQIVIDEEINNGRIDFGDLNELADSIQEVGLRIPLLVKKTRGEDKYVLIQGKRRFKAIQILVDRGIEFAGIRCVLAPVNYNIENSLIDQIVMNDGKPYSNLEQGIVFSQLIERGFTVQEISKKTGKSNTHINHCIEVSSLPKVVQNMISSGSVSGLTAVNLSKVIQSEDELIKNLENAVESAPEVDGKKKKVTNKNIKEIASMSPMKKLEELKRVLSERENKNEISLVVIKLVSRLKAGEDVESMLELFEQ